VIKLFGDVLKSLRIKNNITQSELANAMNVSQSAIAMWETSKREPDFESVKKLSMYFKINPNVFLGISYEPDEKQNNAIRIPVLGRIPAGIPLEAIEDIIDYEEVPPEWGKGGKEYFALKIEGNSMSPKYIENDIVLFLATNDCNSGEDCAVMINGDDATFKKVIKQMDGVVLQPINTDKYTPKFYNNTEIESLPLCILGIAKEIRRKI
jgi:repressor LexA